MEQKKQISVVQCGNGWKKLYQPIIDSIIRHDTLTTNDLDKIGIKEINNDNGVLSIELGYPRNVTKTIKDLILSAKFESMGVCEFCGGTQDIGYTISNKVRTCCERCYNIYLKKEYSTGSWQKRKFETY